MRFPDLQATEAVLSEKLLKFNPEIIQIAEDLIISFRQAVGQVSHEINTALDEYATIDYKSQREDKIVAKALIRYAYDLMDHGMKVLRILSEYPEYTPTLEQYLQAMEDFIVMKSHLMKSTYLELAQEELEVFYNPKIRDMLDSDLDRFLRTRRKDEPSENRKIK